MKIAFLAGHLSRRASGVREVAEHLSAALARRGHDVRVFGLEDAAWQKGDKDNWHGAPATVKPPLGPRSLGYAPGWAGAIRAFDPDVLHLHGIWMASSAVAAGWATRSGKPLVISPHGMLSDVALSYSRGRKRVVSALYQDRCFRAAALYHATVPEEEAEIRAYGLTAPVAVVPIGVPDMPGALRATPPLRQKTVVTLGRMHKKKRIDRLLRAWAQLEPNFPGWDLRIIGPDPKDGHLEMLQSLARDLGLERVAFPGPLFGDDKWRALQSAELFALPTDSENFALTVPEALLAELPVISTDGAPWSMLPAEGAGWSVPRDESALAGALAEGMSLPEAERRAMGARGRAWARQEFDWDKIAERIEVDYERVAQG
ncbi:Glycosyltransferase involved in cell wall bisynthesis [Mameliella alba]|uniref:glycosyltransferase n=1 Tax=Mameliella alba TaxID=561184 RepID=UPI000884DA7F|nr:glycosyltransferase [Mameliella alba]OWV48615.1 hypothetical protein CDZ96_08360 [Mameliella alba]PTR39167.1 glycosyltransferase involved in cell wall biosynthesis [Mameliella alba]GGF63739.1 glycosyl transferase family 1 [Mameliella alba]SDD24968.1 Glycosyltransferase involved in cell wall bisynthesis [Mameliella alba]